MLKWIGIVIGGLVIGVASAMLVLGNGQLLGREKSGGWFGNRNAGSSAADPYTRGIIAKIGLLALNRSETIYFQRYEDEKGARLDASCRYQLSGSALPTRWWSITIYAADNFLPVNGNDAQSIDATRVKRGADGRWTAVLSATRGDAANWVSSRNAGQFSLGLRMYNPEPGPRNDIAMIPFPTIRTISCGEAK